MLGVYVGKPYVDRMLFSASTPRAIAPRGTLSELERTTIELFERVSPSVVQVVGAPERSQPLTDDGDGAPGQSGHAASSGTPPAISSPTITWSRVPARSRCVSLPARCCRRRSIGTAPNYDLAVLRVDDTRSLPSPIAVGASDDLKVGQLVFAIGNPFGLDQSLTTGIISALKRRLPTAGGREITNVIQTDAAINPGQFRRPAARTRPGA